ncbi:MAG: arylsulfatase [Planctomycetota bacterium]|nr:arylsulfatase [Planctomycetota bacterium]
MPPLTITFVRNRRTGLTCSIVVTAFFTALFVRADSMAFAAEPVQRPNIVLIMTDDQGYGDFGVTGNPVIRTPNIDAMAKRSATMTNFYVSPVCAPTRACLMTGRYNYRTRCIDTYIGRAMMSPDEVTAAEILGGNGYSTGIFGKWHLGDCYPMRPMDQGFQESLVHRGGGIGQPSDPPGAEGKYTDPILFRNGVAEQQRGYCTDVYYSNARAFIEKSAKRKQPFFVYLPDNCPHGPFDDVPREDLAAYKQLDLANSAFPQNRGHKLPRQANVDQRARIFAMITNVDRNIGRLFETLKSLGIVDNTLVIFMVDNGPNGRRYVAGYKGNKSHVHEGGIRSPFFVQWPAQLKAGHKSDVVSAHIDVLPTLLDASGIDVPAGLKLDGRSMLPMLKGEAVHLLDRHLVIQSHRGDQPVRYHNFMIRNSKWKLVHPSGFGRESFTGPPKFELYDLANDPYEEHDTAAAQPEVLRQLKTEYDRWFDDVGSTRPNNYAPPRIHVGTPHENPCVLTRQDWRHTSGRPWARDSSGHWLLTATAGNYNIRCRFSPSNVAGVARLRVNGKSTKLKLAANATTCEFTGVTVPAGSVRLDVELTHGEKTRGIHQADMEKMPLADG